MSSKTARTIGISVDMRRKNKSEEGFNRNVDRLKEYMAKVVILSKKEISKRKGQPSFGVTVTKFTNLVKFSFLRN